MSTIAPDTLTIQILKSHSDTEPEPRRLTWPELVSLLTAHPTKSAQASAAEDGIGLRAWIPASLRDGKRGNVHVESVAALVLDFDNVRAAVWAQALETLRSAGLAYCFHSTRSHRPVDGSLCYRLTVQNSAPVAGGRWKPFYKACAEMIAGSKNDESTCDPTRLFYLPALIDGGAEFESGSHEGAPLDVDAVLAQIAEGATNPAPPTTIDATDVTALTRDHLQAVFNGIPPKNKSPQYLSARGALKAIVKGCSFALPGNRDTTLFNVAQVVAREYPYASAASFADQLEASLQAMEQEAPGGLTRELVIQKFERAQEQAIDEAQEQAAKQVAETNAKARHGLSEGIISQPFLVQKLIEREGKNLRYLPKLGYWREWNGRYWTKCEDLPTARVTRTIAALIAELKADGLIELAADLEQHWTSNRVARDVLVLAQHGYPALYASADDFDCYPDLLNTQNCTVDQRTLVKHPHRREDMLTRIAAQPYCPDATCPRFETAMTNALPDPPTFEAQRLIAGSACVGVPQELVVWSYGGGSAGKTGIGEAMTLTLGKQADDGYVNLLSDDYLNPGKSGKHTSEIARCSGARLLIVNDHKGPIDGKALRQACGSRDNVQGQGGMCENYASHKVTWAQLWVSSNDLPHLDSTSHAETKRIETLPYEQTFEKDQSFMKRIVAAEGPGILRWLIDAAHDCLANGSKWTRSEKMGALRDEAIAESDSLADFLRTQCVIDVKQTVGSKELHARYVSWSKANGVDRPLSETKFGQELKRRGYDRCGDGNRMRRGLALRSEPLQRTLSVEAVARDPAAIVDLCKRVRSDPALQKTFLAAGLRPRTDPPPAPGAQAH
jgi:phage/plasmid-associated DNA primase